MNIVSWDNAPREFFQPDEVAKIKKQRHFYPATDTILVDGKIHKFEQNEFGFFYCFGDLTRCFVKVYQDELYDNRPDRKIVYANSQIKAVEFFALQTKAMLKRHKKEKEILLVKTNRLRTRFIVEHYENEDKK